MISVFPDKIFGKNDIRGIVWRRLLLLKPFNLVGKAYAKYVLDRYNKSNEVKNEKIEFWVSLAMDARHHSP